MYENGTAPLDPPQKQFPYPVVFIIILWCLIFLSYLFARWRQRPRAVYIIPRVFVLCSPRTVQFHYELILRVGMPSSDYNPDKHDIDITVQGMQRNEVVPMTRLNTKTLLDEPLITTLSIIVYRLVEMPQLGSLVLRHSGPYRAWLYVYDFTVIDLTTNKEQYYTINKYIGSLNRVYALEEHNENGGVQYPIDDVPLPSWSTEDIYLVVFMVINCIMLSVDLMPLSCDLVFASDIGTICLASLNGGAVIFFLEWLLYYYAKWNSDRSEYFNLNPEGSCWFNIDTTIRVLTGLLAVSIGGAAIYFATFINEWHLMIVWALATCNTCILVIGCWNIARMAEISETITLMGLRMKGIETVSVGMKHTDIVSDMQTKSGSASDDGGQGSTLSSTASKLIRSFGPRSSVKSFGFDPVTGRRSMNPGRSVVISSPSPPAEQQQPAPAQQQQEQKQQPHTSHGKNKQ